MEDDVAVRRLRQAQALAALALRECETPSDFRIARWSMIRHGIGRDIERLLQEEQAQSEQEAKQTRLILTTRRGYQTRVAPAATTICNLPCVSRSTHKQFPWQRRRRRQGRQRP